jgi:FkbM family methyltransferase
MLISVPQLVWCWGVRPTAVLHVGAHRGEEVPAYTRAGWLPVVLVDALPECAAHLQRVHAERSDVDVHLGVAWDADGEGLTMHRTNNGESSSVLPMGSHRQRHPEVRIVDEFTVSSVRLDTLLAGDPRRFDAVMMDIQGAELRALRGLGERLEDVRWIYCEVNQEDLYIGSALLDEVDAYLGEQGFVRVDTRMTTSGWGDALYARRAERPRAASLRRLVRRLWTAAASG